ncbi:MAG: PD-(D/E)XK nuclease family protein, partial [Clostridia bacterium]|nr:PD-(D/E)XK nuclease family protein [Clostridia bacterium]
SLSPFEEATLMTREVMNLVQRGIALERIAVLYPDSDGYAFAVSSALSDSGIPFYTDRQMPASSHGLVQFLLSALHAMADGWRNRDMLTLLKSGYAPFTFEESCDLENYVRGCGIDRLRWTKPFTRVAQYDPLQHERCEQLRLRLMEPLLKARQGLVDARDAASSLEAVFNLLLDAGAYETLQKEEKRLLEAGFTARASQNSQIWQAVLALMDQLVRLGGSARIPLKHIASRLECGFSAITLASLPPASGMLHAGTLGHLLQEDADAVFLLGLGDGLLAKDTDSLLTPEERLQTQNDTGCFLGLTDENRMLLAKLDLKRAMTLPRRFLYLSCARTAPDGAALRPLSLLAHLRDKLLPGISSLPVPEAELPMSATQALGRLSPLMRAHADGAASLSPEWQERLHTLLRSPATAPMAMHLLRSVHFDGAAQPLSPAQARTLYGEDVLSVSRLEAFAECAFRHFVDYGLRPHTLREWKVDPIETGTFYHAGLNNFAKLARRENAFPHMPAEAIERMADKAIEPLLEELLSGPMGDGDRSLARFEAARSAIRRAAKTIATHLSAGRFTLWRTEASFGYEGGFPPIVLVLSDGREVALRGRIDRIDRYDTPDSVYLRVIDYKSSQQNLEAARTWWGLQLQLLLYLDVCTSAIPGAKPAGAFYFYVADPLVETEADVRSVVEDKLREKFQLRGIALSDLDILSAMDEGEVPCVLPGMHLKSGELKKTARALDELQLTALLQHARQVAGELAQRLFEGETVISPMCESSRTACDFCDFRPICRFDAHAPEAEVRQLPSMNMEELRAALAPTEGQEECKQKSCYSKQLHV